jgi:hypothetical protein
MDEKRPTRKLQKRPDSFTIEIFTSPFSISMDACRDWWASERGNQ